METLIIVNQFVWVVFWNQICQINALYQKNYQKLFMMFSLSTRLWWLSKMKKINQLFCQLLNVSLSSIQVMQLGNLAKIGLKLAPDHTEDLPDRTRFVKHCHNRGGLISWSSCFSIVNPNLQIKKNWSSNLDFLVFIPCSSNQEKLIFKYWFPDFTLN